MLVDAEPVVRSELARLRVVVRGSPGDAEAWEQRHAVDLTDDIGSVLPFDLAVVPLDQDSSRRLEVEVVGEDAVGALVSSARARARFTDMQTRVLRVVLEDDCRGLSCGLDETCHDGTCVSAVVMPEIPVPQDGGTTLPRSCVDDADCDDRVYCDGVERCVRGVCAPGVRASCADDLECTVDRCTVGGCAHEADASRCTADVGGSCDLVNGCQYAVCTEFNCTPGACQAARCEGNLCVRRPLCEAGQSCCGGECVVAGCDDSNPCTADLCGLSGCVHAPADELACDDGDACTSGEVCVTGECRPAVTDSCDDGNPCTADACDAFAGCAHEPITATCDDADPCTVDDTCSAGECVGVPLRCDDGVQCTVDSCTAGECVHSSDDASCTAAAGGRCDPLAGCQYGACSPATCAPSPGACETAGCDGPTCVRQTLCADAEMCCAGACVAAGCDDGDPCTDDACRAVGCVHVPGTALCDDGDPCTVGDRCGGGVCGGGGPRDCDDGNPCTDDGCGPSGCVHQANTAPCDDRNVCTPDDRCRAGSCEGRGTLDCPDGDFCTITSCDRVLGCQYRDVTCGGGRICCGATGGCVFPSACE